MLPSSIAALALQASTPSRPVVCPESALFLDTVDAASASLCDAVPLQPTCAFGPRANINVSSLQVQASGCMLGLLLLLFPALAIIQPGLTNHPPSLRCPVFKFTRVVCWLNFRQRPKALKRPESRVTLHGVFLQQQRRRLFRPRGCAPVWEPVAPSIGQLIRT